LKWARYFSDKNLNLLLDKNIVRDDLLSRDFFYSLDREEMAIAILSWGGMNREHGKRLFEKTEWLDFVYLIRNNKIQSRKEAYQMFFNLKRKGGLPGMGPAYYTKLICFINRDWEKAGYIMDQWTAKSINLLCGRALVKMTRSGHVDAKNDSEVYESFCSVIDDISIITGISGIDIEESLFSSGGKYKGKWRNILVHANNTKKIENNSSLNDFTTIAFDQVLKSTSAQGIEVKTLSGKSTFSLYYDSELFLINSKGNKHIIDAHTWDMVVKRMDELPEEERNMTSRYVDGTQMYNWKDCPNRIICAYIPAIIKHINEIG